MITATSALLLPGAALSPSDAEATSSYLADIEEYIHNNMKRVGCTMPVDPSRVNPTIAAEVERTLRSAGWKAEFQKVVIQSKLAPGQSIPGFQLALAPSDEAYAEADKAIKARTDN